MLPKRLRCFVVGCNNEHSSNSFTPIIWAAEEDYVWCWRESALDLVRLMRLFMRIICDPTASTEEDSTRFFKSESEDRGGVSRALSHLKENYTILLALKRADFDRLKKVFLHYHWKYLTKRCYILFIKTLKSKITLWKMGIIWPL